MFEYIEIGKVLKPYRKSGAFLAIVEPIFFDDLDAVKAIFLKIDGLEVPFFLEEFELDVENCLFKVEELESPEAVKPFNGTSILLRKEDISDQSKITDPGLAAASLNGFTIYDLNSKLSFVIEEVREYPQQMMAVVLHNGNETLIPLAEALISEIVPEEMLIKMELPDGLIGF